MDFSTGKILFVEKKHHFSTREKHILRTKSRLSTKKKHVFDENNINSLPEKASDEKSLQDKKTHFVEEI